MWSCASCGQSIDPDFEVCWSCGADRDGNPDPGFTTVFAAPETLRPEGTSAVPRGEIPNRVVVDILLMVSCLIAAGVMVEGSVFGEREIPPAALVPAFILVLGLVAAYAAKCVNGLATRPGRPHGLPRGIDEAGDDPSAPGVSR